ncbi:UDP-N-acetylmuramoyl-tripeptide--D-alanyl-D-alanine ligase [Cytobacillus sp. FSL K6-0129]|uniref:UDP-N-acetylmuramoyl-tripeptide--D-alanyl-D- alanine ligase n=1 Tax=Cytobacillus sp. FSL K6-0129 TaxID=2921421 RepID=UPI0030F60249
MIKRSLVEIQDMLNGSGLQEEYADIRVDGVSIDTRTLHKGNLFIPIMRIDDGHNYVNTAFDRGATATLWKKGHKHPPEGVPVIYVDDPLLALQELATAYREQLNMKVVGVTGSNGKTTTKDMVKSILQTTYKVHKTKGNLNSQIGLPLTILDVEEETEVLVLEMGMSEKGQIHRLSTIAQPDVVVITMVGLAHIATLGSEENIANAKLEIIDGLRDGGLFIYYGDDAHLKQALANVDLPMRVKTFGHEVTNNYYYEKVKEYKKYLEFDIAGEQLFKDLKVSIIGKHNVKNTLAAVAVALELGVTPENIIAGLKNLDLTAMRMETIQTKKGYTIINDAWNASPNSVQAAIETVQEMEGYHQKILVLGDMLELGDSAETLHKQMAKAIDPNEIDFVVTYGILASAIAKEAKQMMGEDKVVSPYTKSEIVQFINKIVKKEALILFKGSREMKLEEVVKNLI